MRLPFAVSACLALSACTDASGALCVAFCTDSTHIQRDYVRDRNECRELSELKLSSMPPEGTGAMSVSAAERANKTRLVAMFSDCMAAKAWAVPSPAAEDKRKDAAPVATAAGAPAKLEPPPPAPPRVLDAQRQRAADCAFARQAADSSIVAKKRAEACELECRQQLKLAPEAPRPPACG